MMVIIACCRPSLALRAWRNNDNAALFHTLHASWVGMAPEARSAAARFVGSFDNYLAEP